jgi:hypothetical protein
MERREEVVYGLPGGYQLKEKLQIPRDDIGEGGASIDIGCADPRSQKRDLGHPLIFNGRVVG